MTQVRPAPQGNLPLGIIAWVPHPVSLQANPDDGTHLLTTLPHPCHLQLRTLP
jgi:hypothetical protein